MGILRNIGQALFSSDDEYELPEYVTDDERLGSNATADDGCTGIVESVLRFSDGTEYIQMYNPQTGLGHGGLTPDQVTIGE